MSAEDPGVEKGGSLILRGLGWIALLSSAGTYMLLSKSSPKYELFKIQFDEDSSLTGTMSNIDATAFALVLLGVGLIWAGRPRSS